MNRGTSQPMVYEVDVHNPQAIADLFLVRHGGDIDERSHSPSSPG